MNWLEIAKNLPVGQTQRVDCPTCGVGTNTKAAIVNHNAKYYSVYCNACGPVDAQSKGVLTLAERKHIQELNDAATLFAQQKRIALPEDTTYDHNNFPREARLWLLKSGLSPTVWKKYHIGYSRRMQRVVLPVYDNAGNLEWFQCRAVFTGQKPKYVQPSGSKGAVMFAAGDTTLTGHVTLVEDIMSAIRVGEAAPRAAAVSILGTKLSSGQASRLSTARTLTTWLDGDKAGRQGASAIGRTLGLLLDVENIRTALDPKEYSNKQIRQYLNIST